MLRKFASVKFASLVTTEEEFNKIAANSALVGSPLDRQIRKVVKYNPDFVYARFKAIGAIEVDGPNANADGFPYGEFLDTRANYGYQSFIGKHAFVEHSSDNINNSIGDLHHAYLNRFDTSKFANVEWNALRDDDRFYVLANRKPEDDGSVEVLMAVDRKLSPTIARMLETGSPTGCSMGTNIDYSECTVCGNRAYVEENYCPHIKFSKGQYVLVPAQQISSLVKSGTLRPEWLPWILQRSSDISAVKTASRKMVYAKAFELNYGLSFFELSVVANPAFSRGYKLEKIASLSKPSAQLMPFIQVAGRPIETIFKISDGYYNSVLGSLEEDEVLLQRSGEIAKNALATGNVQEVLVDQSNAPFFVKEHIELTAAETPGFYKISNPEELLNKTFAKARHRDKLGVVGTIEENFYACANCMSVFDRKTQKRASYSVDNFETFSICLECTQQVGIQRTGDVNMTKKQAEYETLPTTAEFTGDKEAVPGKGAFVGEKEQLYEPWALKGSKLIEKEKEYRPMGTIFIDPIVAKSDLNSRSTRIEELSKSAKILLSRIKLAIEDPGAFMEEMKKPSSPPGMGMDSKPPMSDPLGSPMGSPIDDPLGGPIGGPMGDPVGMSLEIEMKPENVSEILKNSKADLELILEDLGRAKDLIGVRETEASKAIEKKIRWSRRFVNASVKTAESVDMIIADVESAVSDALMKLQKACEVIYGDKGSDIEDTGQSEPTSKSGDNSDDSKGDNPFASEDSKDSKEEKDDSSESSESKLKSGDSKGDNPFASKDKPPKGDDAMAKESTLELTEGNINLLQKLRVAFAGTTPVQTVATDDGDESVEAKDEKSDGEMETPAIEDASAETESVEKESSANKLEKDATLDKEAAAMPPTGARDPGNYGEAGKMEAHEMSRWWQDMYPEFEKMKSAEVAKELNEPEGKVELLTGFLGEKSADDPGVGTQTNAPAIFAKRFTKVGPKWANSFIGVVRLAEDGSTEAFTANFRDIAGETGSDEEFEQFSSEDYLDQVIATTRDNGMNAVIREMRGKVAQLEGITPGKTEKVNPLYDTKEEKKDSNKGRDGLLLDEKDGHGKTAGDTEFYGKAYGDVNFAGDLTTANKRIASLASKIEDMETQARSDKMAEYALHLARVASSRGVCPFDIPNIQKQAMEYIKLDESSIQAVKAHLEKLPVVNQRALEAYQIPEAENMQKGVVHNTVDVVDTVRNQGGSYPQQAENVAPDGIQPSVESNAKVTADVNEDKIRKQAAAQADGPDTNVVPQMHAAAIDPNLGGIPDVTKYFKSTIENQLKAVGAYEANKHLLRSNRR